MSAPLLEVRGLVKQFPVKKNLLGRATTFVSAVDGVDFDLFEGETLGVVGESGCGKSTTARLLMHLIEPTAGTIRFGGKTVGTAELPLKEFRRQVQMVFQDSYASLNPRLTVEESIAFGPTVHGVSRDEANARALSLLDRVGLDPKRFAGRFTHELSGGQRQRVNIARSLALQPRILVLDEAVSALDKSVEAQVLNLLADLKEEFGLTYLFISHDLEVVRFMSTRVLVMYLGRVAELGPTEALYTGSRHPYTTALLGSLLSMDPDHRTEAPPITGDPPNPIDPPSGCRFHTRCTYAEAVCSERMPALLAGAGDPAPHWVACHMHAPRSGHSKVKSGATPEGRMSTGAEDLILDISNLRVTFTGGPKPVRAVDGVDLKIRRGEVVALLGESGSGKSVTLRSILRLHPEKKTRIEGGIRVQDVDVLQLKGKALADFRGKMVSMIFQEPMLAMDPVYSVGRQITESIIKHEHVSPDEARRRALTLFEQVRIPSPERRLDAYPHEMSGGMRQRAMIALALACNPQVLLADEPTTALDATVQVQILLLLRELQHQLGLSMIFVTHDISVGVEVADRIAVMYAGRIVEIGNVRDVIRSPRHPYTIGLMSTRPHGGRLVGNRLPAIPGSPPDLANLPPGCAFAPRCAHASDACRVAAPEPVEVSAGHWVRCVRTDLTLKA